ENSDSVVVTDGDELTKSRKELQKLYSERGIVPAPRDFACPNLPSCSQAANHKLITGAWAYIGTGYGRARVNGRPVKILFVAMDRGGYRGADQETFAQTQHRFRCGTETSSNPHMRGVHLLLRELVDDKNPASFSRQYALTNAVKCARETGRMVTKV